MWGIYVIDFPSSSISTVGLSSQYLDREGYSTVLNTIMESANSFVSYLLVLFNLFSLYILLVHILDTTFQLAHLAF